MPKIIRALRHILTLSALCLGGFRCDRPPADPPTPKALPKLAPPELTLLVLTDPKGYLEPCGCQQRPLGGVDKLAGLVKSVRAEGQPNLLLAAGDLFFGAELHGEDVDGARQQELWKAEALAEIWSSLTMAAVVPGPLDFSLGASVVENLRKRAKFPWLSAQISGSERPFAAALVKRLGAYSVAVVGSHAPSTALPAPFKLTAEAALAERIRALREQGADLVVVLQVGDRRAARAAARAGADLVVAGGLDQADAVPPAQSGDGWIVHAGRQGQGVLRVDLRLSGRGELVNVSEWSVRVEREQLREQAHSLAAKIADWKRDSAVNAQDLATQEQRLAELERRADKLTRPPHKGRWLAADWLELSPDVKSLPAVAAKVDAYDRRVNDHNRVALANKQPQPAPPGTPHYLGSAACGSCHAPALAWWRDTKHGQAYATLERAHKQFNLSCVGCHVTGYNRPGGSTVTHVEKLKNVGCEACHGPGSQHASQPTNPELALARDVSQSVCTSCHNPEHSARFEYVSFKALLVAPGHGRPPKPSPTEKAQAEP